MSSSAAMASPATECVGNNNLPRLLEVSLDPETLSRTGAGRLGEGGRAYMDLNWADL